MIEYDFVDGVYAPFTRYSNKTKNLSISAIFQAFRSCLTILKS